MNYYELLDIKHTENQDEIKTAYRKMAFRYHPDRNNSPNALEKMKLINEAYSVLSDSSLKNDYDIKNNFRSTFRNKNPFNDFDDIFNSFYDSPFGQYNGGFNTKSYFEGWRKQKGYKAEDVDITLNIEFNDAFNGCIKKIKLKHIPSEIININIEKFTRDGHIITIKGKGISKDGFESGNLRVIIKYNIPSFYEIKHNILFYKVDINFGIAVKGGVILLSLPSGNKINHYLESGNIEDLVIENAGWHNNDLIVQFNIIIPKYHRLDIEDKKIIDNLIDNKNFNIC